MLPRSRRLTGDQVRELLSQKARVFHTPLFIIRQNTIENLAESRFSITISKKVSKLAVDRNHMRRQIYSILGGITAIKAGNYSLSVKKKATFDEFLKDIRQFFV